MSRDKTIRAELNAWLDANWDPERPLAEWRCLLVDARWGAVAWPEAHYGRAYDDRQTAVVQAVFAERNIIGAAQSGPRLLISETLLRHGSEAQKQTFLRPLLTGQHAWCQLFSEPGSGSDLAGATTKAVRDGDKWIVNGQKLWTTSAHHADFGFILARTNWDVPKHQGLSFFLMDMRQPGVDVRPLKQMNGYASFNEVFITDAEIPHANLVLAEGEGWTVASTTLAFERAAFSQPRGGPADGAARPQTTARGRIYDEHAREQAVELEPYVWYPQRTGRVDLVVPRAIETGKINDPLVRQEIAKLLSMRKAAQYAAGMAREAGDSRFGAFAKLSTSMIARQAAKVHAMVSGADILGADEAGGPSELVAEILLSVPAISIAGGTDEIQRNIIAERILELPKEPRSDTGPFRDIPRN